MKRQQKTDSDEIMKKRIKKLAVIFIPLGLCLAGAAAHAAEFEVLDKFSVDGYSEFKGSAAVSSGLFTVGASTLVVKNGNVGIGTPNPEALLSLYASDHKGLSIQTNKTDDGTASSRLLRIWQRNYRNALQSYYYTGSWQVSDLLFNPDGGNVGIGTTAPGGVLEIGSALAESQGKILRFTSGGTEWLKLTRLDASSTAILQSAGNIALQTAGGNVGIGTAGPNSRLEVLVDDAVVGDVTSVLRLHHTTSGTPAAGIGAGILFDAERATSPSWAGAQISGVMDSVADASEAMGLRFFTTTGGNSTLQPRVTITGGGNVGVGTADPAAKLHIYGNNSGSPLLSGNNAGLVLQNAYTTTGNTGPSIQFKSDYRGYNTFAVIGGNMESGSTAGTYGSMVFGTKATEAATEVSERMRIDKDGNVGIGTAGPTTILHIKKGVLAYTDVPVTTWDTGLTGYKLALSNYNSGGGVQWRLTETNAGADYPVLTFETNGNVGIGTVSPAATLDLKTGSGNTFAVKISSANDASLMVVQHSGNVGIGTANPAYPIDISTDTAGVINSLFRVRNRNAAVNSGAAIQLDGFYQGARIRGYTPYAGGFVGGQLDIQVNNDSNAFITALTINKIGYVGIGTTGPAEKLDVAGNLSVGPVSGMSSIHRGTVSGSNGIQLSGNINSVVSDTNPGAYINLGGGPLTDAYEGNINIAAYGAAIDDGNRNTIRFLNRSGVDTVTERMRITSGGNIGIGTTVPNDKLHIKSGDIRLQAANQNTGDYSETRSIRFTQETDVETARIMYSRPSWSNAPGDLSFWTRDVDDSVVYERMRIKESGNMGIGTTEPVSKLHIDNPEGTTAYPLYIPSAFSITTSGANNNGSQRTYTLTIPSLNLHTSIVTIDVSGWYYNNGADFWQARYVYNLMSESTAGRINQRQSALEFTAGNQRSSAPATATLATSNVFTIAITVTAGYYSRMVITTTGAGTQQTTVSVQ